MHQAVRVCSRKKRPQPECKKHRKRDQHEKEMLKSMSSEQRKVYFKKKHTKTAKRIDKRKNERIHTHELRLKASQRIGKKRRRSKVRKNTDCATKQVVRRKRTPPSQETITRRRVNERWRLAKRQLKRIITFALRNGVDPAKVICSLPSNIGTKHFKVSEYQQMVLAS